MRYAARSTGSAPANAGKFKSDVTRLVGKRHEGRERLAPGTEDSTGGPLGIDPRVVPLLRVNRSLMELVGSTRARLPDRREVQTGDPGRRVGRPPSLADPQPAMA